MKQAKCKSCGASIIWAQTQAGKAMPVDAAAAELGNVLLKQEGARVVALVLPAPVANAHVSHFATCKDAAKHRRPR